MIRAAGKMNFARCCWGNGSRMGERMTQLERVKKQERDLQKARIGFEQMPDSKAKTKALAIIDSGLQRAKELKIECRYVKSIETFKRFSLPQSIPS
jgi:hypothetical protein